MNKSSDTIAIDLLHRYIRYVGESEGTTFLDHCERRDFSDVKFTDDEWDMLVNLSEKSIDENQN
jgi:hypothetical protein